MRRPQALRGKGTCQHTYEYWNIMSVGFFTQIKNNMGVGRFDHFSDEKILLIWRKAQKRFPEEHRIEFT